MMSTLSVSYPQNEGYTEEPLLYRLNCSGAGVCVLFKSGFTVKIIIAPQAPKGLCVLKFNSQF